MPQDWRLVRRPQDSRPPGSRRSAPRGRRPAAALVLAAAAILGACDQPGPARANLSVAEAMAGDTAGFARADAPRTFTFPADHGPHPDFRTEWWYFTGNLTGDDGRDYGFQLTFFRSALRPDTTTVQSDWATRQAYMGHFALTDVAGGRFRAFERFDRGALGLAGSEGEPMRVWVGDWEARSNSSSSSSAGWGPGSGRSGGFGVEAGFEMDAGFGAEAAFGAESVVGESFRVRAGEGAVAIDLVIAPLKPVVLQGDDGLSRKGPEPGDASYYYSFTRLAAEGTVTAGGETRRVRGLAWLDREWSTSALSPGLAGWDWFALQLDDGSDLMVYRLREDDGGTAPFSAGTFVRADGSVTRLAADDFVLEETGAWSSPRGGSYPSGWRVRVPSLELELSVTPRLRDQELDLAFRYWEGAVAVSGSRAGSEVAGRGYVELTGYADSPRP